MQLLSHAAYHQKYLRPCVRRISLPINQHIKKRYFLHSFPFSHAAEIGRATSVLWGINIFGDFGCRFELARLFFCLSGPECIYGTWAESESRGICGLHRRRDANGNGGALTWNCDQNSLGNKEVQRCWILKKYARGEKRNPSISASSRRDGGAFSLLKIYGFDDER